MLKPVGNVMDSDPDVIAVVASKWNVTITPVAEWLVSLNSIGLLYHADMGCVIRPGARV